MRLLFVCLGNICRSPSAEAIMNHCIEKGKLEAKINCNSAGTLNDHAGQPADQRMRSHAAQRGINLTSFSRQVTMDDFNKFDYLVAMNEDNYADLIKLSEQAQIKGEIIQICDYANTTDCKRIPDPYYGGEQGFETVLNLLEECCLNLLNELKEEL